MSSRKRKPSTNTEKEGTPSKRARLLSSLWQSQEHTLGSPEKSPSNPFSPVYEIRAIIAERPREYLIDWADDPITGEKFRSDWQPKGNVNSAAIEAWENRKLSVQSNDNRRQQRRRRRRLKSKNRLISHDSHIETQESQSRRLSGTPFNQTNNSKLADQSRLPKRITIRSPAIGSSKFPPVTVQISQHSSFDKDLYIAYISSLSTQVYSTSVTRHTGSRLGESSQEPHTSLPQLIGEDGIVPDSQSLPGSSSYVPTSSTSLDETSTDQSPPVQDAGSIIIPDNNTHSAILLSNKNDSTAAAEDIVEHPSVVEVAASQTTPHNPLRLRSEPVTSSTEDSCSTSRESKPTALVRSTSDTAAVLRRRQPQDRQSSVAKRVNTHQSSHNRGSECYRISRSHSRPLTRFRQNRRSSFEVQVLRSTDTSPEQRLVENTAYLEHSAGFQTQVPLSSESQGTRVSTTSADPRLVAQVVEESCRSTFQILPESNGQNPGASGFQSHTSLEIIPAILSSNRRRTTAAEPFVITVDPDEGQHPSQATTTDDSVLSNRDPNSQSTNHSLSEQVKENPTYLERSREGSLGIFRDESLGGSSPSNLEGHTLPQTPNSKEPPIPPLSPGNEMSETSPDKSSLSGGSHTIGIRERLKKIREDGAAKREAQRRAKDQQSQSPSASASPSGTLNEQQMSHPPSIQAPPYQALQRQQSQPLATRGTPILPRSDRRPSQMSIAGSYPLNQEEVRVQMQSSRPTQSPRAMRPASVMPEKIPAQIQREPSRLEVQPVVATKEIPMSVRHSQSVPHTPTTPSKLSMHKEASPAQTITLQPMWLSQMEFIIPLSMQPRILSQYIDTIEYYKRAVKKNLTNETLSRSDLDKLNELLGRLANVSTHIGLEGGGPTSQEEVLPEQEAAYAESSSEKFNFLGYLLTLMKDYNAHIALICKPDLLETVEVFLKGKKVRYARPDKRTRSGQEVAHCRLEVSLIASGETGASVVPRTAELVVALDETFKSGDPQVMALRKHMINIGQLAPVVRLVVYSSVEHLDLCFQPTLAPIDRIRKLIFYVWNTQRIVGQLEAHEPLAKSFAEKVAAILQVGDLRVFWNLPRIAPIENLPAMDSDSTLSDPLSDMAIEELRPDVPHRYWPNSVPSRVGDSSIATLPGGKRPFDLEYGDSLEVQAKKQKMAARVHRGLPIEEPPTNENLQRWLNEAREREKLWAAEKEYMENTIQQYRRWAEVRQAEFESLRAKHGNLYHDKIDLKNELDQAKSACEKGRAEISSLQAERSTHVQTIAELRSERANSSDTLIAATEREAARARALEAEVASLKKKNENLSNESATVRGVYQEASTAAADLATTIQTLESELGPLRRRLEELELRRKADKKNDPKIALLRELDNLKAQLRNRERLVIKKEDEIRELKRGRGGVQTRGSSVAPRSPRGGNGAGAGAGGSRGASPAAGMLGAAGEGREGKLSRRFNLDG